MSRVIDCLNAVEECAMLMQGKAFSVVVGCSRMTVKLERNLQVFMQVRVNTRSTARGYLTFF